MGVFRRTLAVAVVGHVLVAAPFVRGTVRPQPVPVVEPTIALEDLPPPLEEPRPIAPKPSGGASPTPPLLARPSVALAVAAVEGEAVVTERGGPAMDAPPIIVHDPGDGIGLYRGLGRLARERVVGPEPPAPEPHAAEHALRDALAEQDRARGFARSGPLVTAAHAAASRSAPVHGTVTIDVDSDAFGIVRSAHADNSLWDLVAEGIVAEMKGKTMRAPPGAGLRTRLRLTAELARPSGEHGTMSIGAVSDDAPGSGSSCVGTGLTRKCLNGMPVGFTYAKKDLANAGAAPRRVVHVDILSEAELR